MKSGNAQLQTQREHSGQTAGKLNALLVTFLTLFGWLLVACGTTTTTRRHQPPEHGVRMPCSNWSTRR